MCLSLFAGARLFDAQIVPRAMPPDRKYIHEMSVYVYVVKAMYACMCVCMFACTYVYACMCVCIFACTYVRMYVRTYVCRNACMHVCVYASD